MSIAERIKEARNAKGMTQTELGKAIGQTAGAVTNYEKGTREPNIHKIKEIAAALGVSSDWLLETEYANKAQEDELISDSHKLRDEKMTMLDRLDYLKRISGDNNNTLSKKNRNTI